MRARLRFAAFAALAATLTSGSAHAENHTTVEVTAVLASYQGRSFDRRLSSLRREFRGLPFRSYTYLDSATRELHGNGEEIGIDLPHGRFLYLSTREHTSGHLKLHILLNEDNRPVVNTFVKLELGSVVLLGGPRDSEGTLFLAIGSSPGKNPVSDNSPNEKRKNECFSFTGSGRNSGSPSASAPKVVAAPPSRKGAGAAEPSPQSRSESAIDAASTEAASVSPPSEPSSTASTPSDPVPRLAPPPSDPSSVVQAGLRPGGSGSAAMSSLVPAAPGR